MKLHLAILKSTLASILLPVDVLYILLARHSKLLIIASHIVGHIDGLILVTRNIAIELITHGARHFLALVVSTSSLHFLR